MSLSLVLGSSSPYRKALLARLGIHFLCMSPDIDEQPLEGENPQIMAERLAYRKALRVSQTHPHSVVIGSDQVAYCIDQPYTLLQKPEAKEKALEQLQLISGKLVVFYTAVSIISPNSTHLLSHGVFSYLTFRVFSDAEIVRYIAKEPAFDCVGAAKIEGLGISLLDKFESEDPTAIIGLPLIIVSRFLRQCGFCLP